MPARRALDHPASGAPPRRGYDPVSRSARANGGVLVAFLLRCAQGLSASRPSSALEFLAFAGGGAIVGAMIALAIAWIAKQLKGVTGGHRRSDTDAGR